MIMIDIRTSVKLGLIIIHFKTLLLAERLELIVTLEIFVCEKKYSLISSKTTMAALLP